MSLMHRLDEEQRRGLAVAWLAFLVAMLVAGIDQAVKVLILIVLDGYSALVIAPGIHLIAIWNTGISFGLVQSDLWYSLLFRLIAFLGIGFLVLGALGSGRRITGIALGLLIGGALSSLIDRVRLGAVLDYLQLTVMGLLFPAANLADLAMALGILLLAIDQFFIAGTVYVPAASRVARSARPWLRR